jgi:flagellar assembly protein FliH
MSLSKVYRDGEAGDLKEFQFRSFGDPEPQAPVDSDSFTQATAAAPAAKVAPAPVAVPLAKQLDEAFARGRQEGLTTAEQHFEMTTRALTKALEDVSRLRNSLAQSGSQDMLRLVMAVAEQVILRSVEADPAVIVSIIEKALQASVRADSYQVFINPAELEVGTEQKPLFLASISGMKNISFAADPQIARGGCRVDSELGNVDATIETQLAAIRSALDEAIVAG